MGNGLAMSRRLVLVLAAALALSGCCLGSDRYIPPPTNVLTSWDGLGPLPKRNHPKRVKIQKASEVTEDTSPNEDELAKLRPYSKEWGEVLDAINRAADAKLRKRLIICRGCLPPEPDDQTASIEGFLRWRPAKDRLDFEIGLSGFR
jgi:hypothetical protein